MASVSKETAEKEAARMTTLKRPSYYCIVRYDNLLTGRKGYSLCKGAAQFEAVLSSPAVGEVEVLFASRQFNADRARTDEMERYD